MYCTKCGNPLNTNEKYCTKCGEKIEFHPTQNPLYDEVCIENESFFSKYKIMHLLSAIFFLLSGIFILTKTFSIKSFGFSQGMDIFIILDTLFDISFSKSIVIVIYILSLLMLILPIAINKKIKAKNTIPAIITSIIAPVFLIVVLFIADSKTQGLAIVSFSASGWVALVSNILTHLFLYLTCKLN